MFLIKRGNAQNAQTTRFSFSTLAEQCGYSTLAEHYLGETTVGPKTWRLLFMRFAGSTFMFCKRANNGFNGSTGP